jgi:hypothetical protein
MQKLFNTWRREFVISEGSSSTASKACQGNLRLPRALRWQMERERSKPWYPNGIPKRYPNGTLSHSWWMDGYYPVHMVVRGFDPYPLVIFGRIRLDVPSLPRCNKLLEGYPPACRPDRARILDIWFLEVGWYLHLCCLSWRSILKVRNWHSISIIYAHKKSSKQLHCHLESLRFF